MKNIVSIIYCLPPFNLRTSMFFSFVIFLFPNKPQIISFFTIMCLYFILFLFFLSTYVFKTWSHKQHINKHVTFCQGI